jgi:hypothetical protein
LIINDKDNISIYAFPEGEVSQDSALKIDRFDSAMLAGLSLKLIRQTLPNYRLTRCHARTTGLLADRMGSVSWLAIASTCEGLALAAALAGLRMDLEWSPLLGDGGQSP